MSKVIIKQKRHISKDVLSVNIVGYVVIGIFALLCLLPFYLIIVASFTDEAWYMMCVRYLNFKNSYIAIILPLSKPLIATLSLFSALAYWNDWYNCMLFITDENKFMLQYYLQRILSSAEAMRIVAEKSGMALPTIPLESMKMAMTVIATGPIVLLYPFVQRYFVKGLTIGAVKG